MNTAGEQIVHTQLICNEAFAIVDGLLLELERVREERPEEEIDQWDYC
jgi:hypothetical protein